ncbi:hypothetical protein BDV28DRAFT_146427 [Aspergillus coremiiformis]|uniref:Fungal-type protein kinase domain-containing protein n=1 Tax=Aspergillus coremiiformis TaxID=138285 RepID=A0A5N6ZE03_9EURO|nr:hypothetical protein BDV28DRAFT_146427 [Aspergillus coremiiformis]
MVFDCDSIFTKNPELSTCLRAITPTSNTEAIGNLWRGIFTAIFTLDERFAVEKKSPNGATPCFHIIQKKGGREKSIVVALCHPGSGTHEQWDGVYRQLISHCNHQSSTVYAVTAIGTKVRLWKYYRDQRLRPMPNAEYDLQEELQCCQVEQFLGFFQNNGWDELP